MDTYRYYARALLIDGTQFTLFSTVTEGDSEVDGVSHFMARDRINRIAEQHGLRLLEPTKVILVDNKNPA